MGAVLPPNWQRKSISSVHAKNLLLKMRVCSTTGLDEVGVGIDLERCSASLVLVSEYHRFLISNLYWPKRKDEKDCFMLGGRGGKTMREKAVL
jgi:hypothetical protein